MVSSAMPVRYAPIVVRLLTVTEAQERVLERVRTLPLEPVPIAEAAGRVLGEDARALVDLPPFESSAMDGFAVRAADLPGRLPVVEHIAAGRPATGPLGPGESMGIATGGVVPAGADAVVPVEYVVHHDNDIVVDEAPEPGANVRPRGGDLRAGEVVVPAGVRLGAAAVGALAAAGVAVKPGKPVSFGVRGETLVFGLPGNPVSSLVGFELFVRPALLALQGLASPLPRLERGRLAKSVRRNPARDELIRARSRLDPDGIVLEPLEGQESHMIARAALADALVLAPMGEGELEAGEPVAYLPLR